MAALFCLNSRADDVVRSKVPQPTSTPEAMVAEDVPLPALDGVLKNAKNNPYIYGIFGWGGEYLKHREDLKKVGWKTIRIGGPLNDKVVDALLQDDLEVIYTWCIPTKKDANPAGDQEYIDTYIKGLADVVKTAKRFKPGSFYIECFNEPNFQYLIKPDDRPNDQQVADRLALYAKMLPATHEALRGTGIPLIGIVAGGASNADVAFIENLHNKNPEVAKSYEILATHPYSMFPDAVEKAPWGQWSIMGAYKKIRETMAAHGNADKPVWYTEAGWQISHADGGQYEKIVDIPTTPDLQAAYTCRLYACAQRLGVERVTNMFITDSDGYNGGFFALMVPCVQVRARCRR